MESVKLKKSGAPSAALRSAADEDDDEGQRASKPRQTRSPAELRRRRVRRHASSVSSSLERQRHRAAAPLQLCDRQWVRQDLRRGSVHVHDRLTVRSLPPRLVLCTADCTAAEIAQRLSGNPGSVLRLAAKTDVNGNCDGDRLLLLEKEHRFRYDIYTEPQDEDSVKRSAGSDVESNSDLSSGARLSRHRDSLSDDMTLGTDASALEGLDTYGSSSDELELDCPVTDGAEAGPAGDWDSGPALYVQLHGEAARRLGPEERPLQIQNDFLFKLGFKDPWRVQEEGMNTELGSLLRFYAGKPCSLHRCLQLRLE